MIWPTQQCLVLVTIEPATTGGALLPQFFVNPLPAWQVMFVQGVTLNGGRAHLELEHGRSKHLNLLDRPSHATLNQRIIYRDRQEFFVTSLFVNKEQDTPHRNLSSSFTEERGVRKQAQARSPW
jgi:hypothetical protein